MRRSPIQTLGTGNKAGQPASWALQFQRFTLAELLRTPRALFSAPLLLPPSAAEPDMERRIEDEEGAAMERRRLLADPTFCCSAARRAAASAEDSRADKGTRGMLLLRGGDLVLRPRLGRAVRLPLGCAAERAAADGGEGLSAGMRLLLGACRYARQTMWGQRARP